MTYIDNSSDLEQIADFASLLAPYIVEVHECEICKKRYTFTIESYIITSSCSCKRQGRLQDLIDTSLNSVPVQTVLLIGVLVENKNGGICFVVENADPDQHQPLISLSYTGEESDITFYEEAIHHLKTKFQQTFMAEKPSAYVMGVIMAEPDFARLGMYVQRFGISICCKQPFGMIKKKMLEL